MSEVYFIQVDDVVREMSDDEVATLLEEQSQTTLAESLEAKASALAKLAALGLTEEEIAAL